MTHTSRWDRRRAWIASSAWLWIAAGCGSSPPPTAPPQIAQAPARPVRDYPPTKRDDVVDTVQNTQVHDPYRWLEDASSPDVQAWMKAQDGYARDHLAKLPNHDAIAARLAQLFYFDSTGLPQHRGDRFFYTRKRKDQEKGALYWKQGEQGQEQVLLDPNTWATDGSASLHGWWPSDDGHYVAFDKSEHNADEVTTGVVDVTTGKPLPDTLAGTKYSEAAWAADGKGFYYIWVPPVSADVTIADRPGFAQLRYHALGSDQAKDPVLHDANKNPQTLVGVHTSHDGHWLFFQVDHGWNSSDIYFRDLRSKQKTWTPLVEGLPALFEVEAFKDKFYVRTNDGAPLYHVFTVDPRQPDRLSWKELVPPADGTLQSAHIIGGKLVLNYLRKAASEVELHDLNGVFQKKLDVPALGDVAQLHGQPTDDDGYLQYTSFTVQQVIYKFSVKDAKVSEWSRIQLPVDSSQFVTEQVTYPSKDGTPITMFLVHKKDAVKDGKTPVFLTGYGGFNQPVLPGYVSSRSSWGAHALWLEHGGMLAVPNMRGGGEYGEDWHKAGMLFNKQNVFDDFIYAARWLEASGWTSKDHVAIVGGSNGGLLVGAAMTQAPELFKAVACEVPLLDMVRYHLFGSGKTWVPEYGSAENNSEFQTLFAYSPYHHVEQVAYPALLMLSADHDDRVDPLHARKFTAAVQAASTSDAPAWLRIQTNAGHAGVDQVKLKIALQADVYAFLMWQLGMK